MSVQWDDGYTFKLTSLARVNFTPHKPKYRLYNGMMVTPSN